MLARILQPATPPIPNLPSQNANMSPQSQIQQYPIVPPQLRDPQHKANEIRKEEIASKTGTRSKSTTVSNLPDQKGSNRLDIPDSGPNPSVNSNPGHATQPNQKHQGADRPHEDPPPGSERDESVKAKKKQAEDAQKSAQAQTNERGLMVDAAKEPKVSDATHSDAPRQADREFSLYHYSCLQVKGSSY